VPWASAEEVVERSSFISYASVMKLSSSIKLEVKKEMVNPSLVNATA